MSKTNESTVLSYDELKKVSEWAVRFFTKEYYFKFEGKNDDPILVAMLPLSNGCTSIEKYHIKDIRKY